jgi:hypothetical protein
MSITVKLALALTLPLAPASGELAVTVWGPGVVWVGTEMMALKVPATESKTLITTGTVGTTVPSHSIEIVLRGKPEPLTVIAEKPVGGVKTMAGAARTITGRLNTVTKNSSNRYKSTLIYLPIFLLHRDSEFTWEVSYVLV